MMMKVIMETKWETGGSLSFTNPSLSLVGKGRPGNMGEKRNIKETTIQTIKLVLKGVRPDNNYD